MIKNKFKIFALDGPWGPSSGNNNPGSGGGFSGGGNNNDSIDDLLKDLKNKYKIKMPFNGGMKGISFILVLIVLGWLATGFYRVEPDEQGVSYFLVNGMKAQPLLVFITFFQHLLEKF